MTSTTYTSANYLHNMDHATLSSTSETCLDLMPAEIRQKILMEYLHPLAKSATAVEKAARDLAQLSLKLADDTLWVLQEFCKKRPRRPPTSRSDRDCVRVSISIMPSRTYHANDRII